MSKKSRSSLGIDIGHHSIKIVQVEKHAGGYRLVASGVIPTPADTVRDGVVADPKLVGFAIKAAMKEARIGFQDAVIAASGAAVFVRPIPFPKMTATLMRDSLKFEAGRYVPGSLEDSLVEAEIIGPIDDNQMNVLLVSAPKETIHSRVAACEQAGISVEVVEIESFATFRAAIECDPSRDYTGKTFALIDIGSASTTVTIIQDDVFLMQRSIAAGGNTLTDALVAMFKLPVEDAEEGKSHLDLSDALAAVPSENPPLRVIQPHVDDMIREIRRSLNYFQSQQIGDAQSRVLDRILLSGGGAKLKGLDQYMSHKLGLPVELVGAFTNTAVSSSFPEDENGLELTVALGLAMRSFQKAA